jgi:Spy/CpxP family protein refolding chaperone
MTMKLSTKILGAICAFALVAGPAFAQNGPPPPGPGAGYGPGHGPGATLRHCLKILNLSDDQKAQIFDYLDSQKTVLQGLHDAARADREALRQLLEAQPQDACAIGSAAIQVKSDRDAVRTEIQTVRATIESYLTPDQATRFEGCLDGVGRGPNH